MDGTKIEEINNEASEVLKFKIQKITSTGAAILKFNKDIYDLRVGDITNMVVDEIEKPWVEVQLVPGGFSNQDKLGYNATIFFADSRTIIIEMNFKNPDPFFL